MLPHTYYTNTPFGPHVFQLRDNNGEGIPVERQSTPFPSSSSPQGVVEPRPMSAEYFPAMASTDDPIRETEGLNLPKRRHATTGSHMSIVNQPTADESIRSFSSGAGADLELTQRTAQACERCKLRKMKCDSNPNGCAQCSDANKVCFQIDRVTKARTPRGEVERIRGQNEELLRENQTLKIQQQHFLQEIQRLNLELRNLHGLIPLGEGAQAMGNETAFPSNSGVSQQQSFPTYPSGLALPNIQNPPSFTALPGQQGHQEALELSRFSQDPPPFPSANVAPLLHHPPTQVEPVINQAGSFSDARVGSSNSFLIMSSAPTSPETVLSSDMTRIQGLDPGFVSSPGQFIFDQESGHQNTRDNP